MKLLMKFRKTIMFIIKFGIIAAMAMGFMNIWFNYYQDAVYSVGSNYIVYCLLFFPSFTVPLK